MTLMATLLERVETDYKTALKAQDRLRVDTLRLIKAAAQRVAMDKRKDALDDQEMIQVMNQQAKQRHETIDSAKPSGRQDIMDQANAELAIITAYLPQPLSAEAITRLIDEALASVGPNQGQIMRYVMSKAGGAVDGKTVNQLVGQRLKQSSAPA